MVNGKVTTQKNMLIKQSKEVDSRKTDFIISIFGKYNLSQSSISTQFTSFSQAKYNYSHVPSAPNPDLAMISNSREDKTPQLWIQLLSTVLWEQFFSSFCIFSSTLLLPASSYIPNHPPRVVVQVERKEKGYRMLTSRTALRKLCPPWAWQMFNTASFSVCALWSLQSLILGPFKYHSCVWAVHSSYTQSVSILLSSSPVLLGRSENEWLLMQLN